MKNDRGIEPISVLLEGNTLVVGTVMYTLEFPLNVFILLEFLEAYQLELKETDKRFTQKWLEAIDTMLIGKIQICIVKNRIITYEHVVYYKKLFFEKYIRNKLLDGQDYALDDFKEFERMPETVSNFRFKVFVGTKEYTCYSNGEQHLTFRKTLFLKHGLHEIRVIHQKESGPQILLQSNLLLDLEHEVLKGKWFDVMLRLDNEKITLRCIALISREICHEVTGVLCSIT